MLQALSTHFAKFVSIEEAKLPKILSYFQSRTVKKKEILLQENELCKTNYFVVKGCLRMYFMNEKGVEQTTQFGIENWWICDYMAFQNQKTAHFSIQAVENSEIIAIDFLEQENVMQEFPEIDRYFRIVQQKANAASQIRMKYMYDYSKEDLYRQFSGLFPEFVNRIPQYLLASYLGFTPEYLSEIRKKYVS